MVRQGDGVALIAANGKQLAFAGPPGEAPLSFAQATLGTGQNAEGECFGIASPQVTAVQLLGGASGSMDALIRPLPDGTSVYFLGVGDGQRDPTFQGTLLAIDSGCNVVENLNLKSGQPDPGATYDACSAGSSTP